MAALFPEGGSDHFVGTAFWPMLLVCLGALALVEPSRRMTIWAAAIYVTVLVLAFAIPNPLGQNALRPGVVLGPVLLVLFTRPRAPRAGGRRARRGAALPAVAAGRARGRGGARRPVDRGRVPRRGAALPRAAGGAGRAARGAAHAQPLGGDVPGAVVSARARLAPPARPQDRTRCSTSASSRPSATSAGCARTPSAGSRSRTRRSTSPPRTSASCCWRASPTWSSATRAATGRSGRCATPSRRSRAPRS